MNHTAPPPQPRDPLTVLQQLDDLGYKVPKAANGSAGPPPHDRIPDGPGRDHEGESGDGAAQAAARAAIASLPATLARAPDRLAVFRKFLVQHARFSGHAAAWLIQFAIDQRVKPGAEVEIERMVRAALATDRKSDSAAAEPVPASNGHDGEPGDVPLKRDEPTPHTEIPESADGEPTPGVSPGISAQAPDPWDDGVRAKDVPITPRKREKETRGQDTGATSAERSSPASPSDPVDLWAKFDPPTLPRGLLPDVIERFAHDQGMTMGADMAGVAVGALVVCAAAIPDKIKLQVKRHNHGWLESARLWVALVGPVSAKKSPIMSSVVRPLRRIDSEMARRYSEERCRLDRLPAEERKQTNPPKHTRLLLQDTTIEAAQDIIKDSPDGVLSYHDELSGWFGSMDKYSGSRGAAKDRAFWLEAYNGAPYSVNRVGRGSVYLENLSVSILGGIQPEPIRKLSDESMDDGLLQRLSPVVLRPAVEGRDEPQSDVVAEYAALINCLHGLGDETTLRFDEGAQHLRQELERKHLELQSIEALNRKLAAHIGKYDGIFARLCVVWHCVENAGDRLPAVIAEATARRAGDFLHRFLLPHAVAFYAGTLGLSNDHDRLAAVAGYILARKLERITNRDVQRGDRTMRGLERREIDSVFDQLDALGWIDRVPGPRPTDPPHWIVNPTVHAKFAERAKAEKGRRERERAMIVDLIKGQTKQHERSER